MSLALDELARRGTRLKRGFPYIDDLFPEQRAFADDPSKAKAALCGRRAGKTTTASADLMREAETYGDDGTLSVYIALTRGSAKLLCWDTLHRLNDKYQLGFKLNDTELLATSPGKGRIKLFGAEEKSQIEKLRGLKVRKAYIDEAASFRPHIQQLMEDVIEPSLLDCNGTLAVIGSPGIVPQGFFHDVTTGKESGWSVHAWTMLENPFLPHARSWLEQRMKAKGWTWDNPIVRREYLGKWTSDKGSLVYPYSPENVVAIRPPSSWDYVVGIDLGFRDPTAFVVMAFSQEQRDAFIIEAFKRSEMTVTDIVDSVRGLQEKYSPFRFVCDTGGAGAKNIAEEITKRHGITIKAAEKTNKRQYQELLRDDLRTLRLKVVGCSHLLEEWDRLAWDPEKEDKEDPRCENHLADATLYAFREARHWMHEPAPVLPQPGEAEYDRFVEREMERREVEAMETELSKEWWER